MQVEAHKLARTFRCYLFHSDTSLRKFSRNRVGKTRPGNSLAPKLQLDRTEFKRHFQVRLAFHQFEYLVIKIFYPIYMIKADDDTCYLNQKLLKSHLKL